MKKLTHIQTMILCLLAAVGIALCIFAAVQVANSHSVPATSNKQLTISHESGFYENNIILEVSGENVTQIY